MARLDHWKADELRALASKFRDQASRTKLEKYIELLSHTAEDLEHEAELREGGEAPEDTDATAPGRMFDIRV
jgi:hypothetical protein